MDKKISQLIALSTTFADTDLVEVSVDMGAGTYQSRKMTFLQLRTAFTKLQANLDVNSFDITSTSNGNIVIKPNGTGAVLLGGNSTQATELRFMEDSDNGTNYVALKVAAALAASTTYTLPTADGTAGQVLSTDGSGILSWAASGGATTNVKTSTFGCSVNGGGFTPLIGIIGYTVIPYNGTITGWSMVSDVLGDCQIDVWKAAGTIPTSLDSIVGSEPPELLLQQINSDNSLSTWTTAVTAGDVIGFNLDSASTLTNINLIITIVKT